jgi:hypothetical protein
VPVSKAISIMSEMVGTALDPLCFDALQGALKRVDPAIAA